MIKLFLKILKYILVIGISQLILSFTLFNPSFVTPIYKLAKDAGFFKDKPNLVGNLYPVYSISKINRNLIWGPRGSVIGTVKDKVKADDGDWHINVRDSSGSVLVVEFVPEYKTSLPNIGSEIKVWGILRYDMEHRWWEIHPAMGWEPAGK